MFSIWNNGRSVFNLDHIVRILVYERAHSTTSLYNVLTTTGIDFEVTGEEYQLIMKNIQAKNEREEKR